MTTYFITWCPGDACDPCDVCNLGGAAIGINTPTHIQYNFGTSNLCTTRFAWPFYFSDQSQTQGWPIGLTIFGPNATQPAGTALTTNVNIYCQGTHVTNIQSTMAVVTPDPPGPFTTSLATVVNDIYSGVSDYDYYNTILKTPAQQGGLADGYYNGIWNSTAQSFIVAQGNSAFWLMRGWQYKGPYIPGAGPIDIYVTYPDARQPTHGSTGVSLFRGNPAPVRQRMRVPLIGVPT